MIEVTKIDKLADIPSHEWNSLLFKNETNTIFLTHQWISCWMNSLGESKELFVLTARENNRLVGIAPLLIWRKKYILGTARTLDFIGMGESDYCDFIAEPEKKPEILKAFFDYIVQMRKKWDLVSLDNIPESSSTPGIIHSYFSKTSMELRETVSSRCPTLIIRGHEEFANKCVTKQDIRKDYNRLRKRGKLEYHLARNIDEILCELDKFFEFHEDRRLILGDRSRFMTSQAREFYKRLVEMLHPKGWLRFDILRFNDKPISYHFGFIYNNSLLYYTTTWNLDFYKYSPGYVLFRFILDDCIRKKLLEFDFLKGTEPYKERFSNEVRTNLKLEAYPNRFILFFCNLPRKIMNRIKVRSPRLYSLVKAKFDPSMVSNIKDDFTMAIKNRAIFKTVLTLFKRIFDNYVFSSKAIIIFKNSLGDRKFFDLGESISIRRGQFSDLKHFVNDSLTLPVRRNFLASALDKLNNGEKLYVVEKNNRMIRYAWAKISKRIDLHDIRSHLDLIDRSGLIFVSQTPNDREGYDIYSTVLCRIIDDFEKEGISEIYTYCLSRDIDSMKIIEKAGFKPYVVMTMIRFAGITRCLSKHLDNPQTKKPFNRGSL